MITINNKVQIRRLKKKKSCYWLAKKVGVSSGTIYNFEKGKPISTATLEKIATALDADIILQPKK